MSKENLKELLRQSIKKIKEADVTISVQNVRIRDLQEEREELSRKLYSTAEYYLGFNVGDKVRVYGSSEEGNTYKNEDDEEDMNIGIVKSIMDKDTVFVSMNEETVTVEYGSEGGSLETETFHSCQLKKVTE